MRIRALRGVCIGVNQNLKVGAEADLDPAQVQFLTSIGAVEVVPDPAPEPDPAPAADPVPEPDPAAGRPPRHR